MSVRILKALKDWVSFIVMMNSSVPSNTSAMKKQQNIPVQPDCPLYTADDTHTESVLERALGWVCHMSEYNRGTRGPERSSNVPKVTQQEAGVVALQGAAARRPGGIPARGIKGRFSCSSRLPW